MKEFLAFKQFGPYPSNENLKITDAVWSFPTKLSINNEMALPWVSLWINFGQTTCVLSWKKMVGKVPCRIWIGMYKWYAVDYLYVLEKQNICTLLLNYFNWRDHNFKFLVIEEANYSLLLVRIFSMFKLNLLLPVKEDRYFNRVLILWLNSY